MTPKPSEVIAYARQVAEANGLDPNWIERKVRQESGGQVGLVSSAGARGPMQLMPGTAKDLGVNPDDWRQNVQGGVRYAGQMLQRFGGDQALASAAYNAGPGNVQKYGGVPPFAETQNYVRRVAQVNDPLDEIAARHRIGAAKPAQASDDPLDAIASKHRLQPSEAPVAAPAAPQVQQPSGRSGVAGTAMGVARGVKDVVDTGAELLPRGLSFLASAGGYAPNAVSNWLGQESQRLRASNKAEQDQFSQDYTGAGAGAGRFVGRILPALAVPVVGLKSAAAVGAGMGLLTPADSDQDRIANTAFGLAGGAGGQVVGNTLARALGPTVSRLTPESQRLAAVAQRENIPLSAADITGSRPQKIMQGVFSSLPTTAAKEASRSQAAQTAFNQAVGRTMGENTDEITSAVVRGALDRSGKEIGDILAKTPVPVNNTLLGQLGQIQAQANSTLIPAEARIVANRLEDLLGKVDQNGNITGAAYQAWRRSVQKQAEGGNSFLNTTLRDLYRSVDQAAYQAVGPSNAAALQTARGQYSAAKLINPIAAKSTDGNISAPLLANATNRTTGELRDIAAAGKRFLPPFQSSGTQERLAMQGLLTGGALGYGGFTGDWQNAALGAAGSLALPRAAQAVMYSSPMQRYLTQGVMPMGGAQFVGRSIGAAAPAAAIAAPAGFLGYMP